MTYEFSWMWFFIGLAIVVAGAFWAKYYKQVADNMGSGVASYDRYKIYAIVTCVVGLLMMFNLHMMILEWVARTVFGAGR